MKNYLLKNAAISALLAEAAALIFLVASAFFTYNQHDPDKMSMFFGICSLYFGAIICGVISGLLNRNKTIWIPVVSSIFFIAIQVFSTVLLSNNSFEAIPFVIKALTSTLLSSIIGIIISGKERRRTNRKRSRR